MDPELQAGGWIKENYPVVSRILWSREGGGRPGLCQNVDRGVGIFGLPGNCDVTKHLPAITGLSAVGFLRARFR